MTRAMYSRSFYSDQASISQRSAETVLPIIIETVRPTSVVDVGCGAGTWLETAMSLGVSDVLGIDFGAAAHEALRIPPERFLQRDLTEPIDLGRSFDLAISLEVAEHLPERLSRQFVATMASLAPVVMFSAATPGQGGTGHVNEQWQSYWVERFADVGYAASGLVRSIAWDDDSVAAHYAQNTLLFASERWVSENSDVWTPLAEPIDVIHPRIYSRQTSHPILFGLSKRLPAQVKNAVTSRLRGTRFFRHV